MSALTGSTVPPPPPPDGPTGLPSAGPKGDQMPRRRPGNSASRRDTSGSPRYVRAPPRRGAERIMGSNATNLGAMLRVPRLLARSGQHAVDALVLSAAYAAAFLVRFEGSIPAKLNVTLAVTLPIVVTGQMLMMRAYDVHKVAWRYVSLGDVRRVVSAISIATLVLLFVRTLIGSAWVWNLMGWKALAYFSSPIGVLLID